MVQNLITEIVFLQISISCKVLVHDMLNWNNFTDINVHETFYQLHVFAELKL